MRDAAAVAALFAADGGHDSPCFTETQVGREAIEATVRGGLDEIHGLRIPVSTSREGMSRSVRPAS